MTSGPENYAAAVKLLRESRGITADDLEPAQLLAAVLAEAQVHATLALAAVHAPTTQTLAEAAAAWSRALGNPAATPVWWLDDGEENPEPALYLTYVAAIRAGEKQFRDANPTTTITIVGWHLVDEHDHDSGSELVVNDQRTGITVHQIQPKGEL